MCFSAEASFGAGALLLTSGFLILKKEKPKEEMLFAAIPLIFGIHQTVEGLVWMGLSGKIPSFAHQYFVSLYAFIAYVLWPTYIPYSCYMIEKNPEQKRKISHLVKVGFALSVFLFFYFMKHPVVSSLCQYKVHYDFGLPEYAPFLIIPYVATTIISFFFVKQENFMYFGILFAFSYFSAIYLSAQDNVPSTWCFFAALVSYFIYYHYHPTKKASWTELQRELSNIKDRYWK